MLTEKERSDLEQGKPSWKIFLITFSFLIAMLPAFIYFFYRNAQRKAIRQHSSFTTATITRLRYYAGRQRNCYIAHATYQVNQVPFTCTGWVFATLTPNQRDSLVGVRLPVVYEQMNPSNGELLSSQRQFDRFDLDLPDSLAWTKSYFFK